MQLRSYIKDDFVTGHTPRVALYNSATEAQLAETSATGIDMASAVAHARGVGGPALRALTFHSRGQLLTAASRALHQHRDELLALAVANGGNTRGDAKFDVDGAIGTLAAYGEIGVRLGECNELRDGEGAAPARSAKLWGEHLFFPRTGVAVHINAFNFPAWGLCEKAAVAWLAGVPVISKPATSTAMVACRIAEILHQARVLPAGALQLIAGGVGDLLDHLGAEDMVAFTGSSDTAQILRKNPAVLSRGARLNIEADSLNSAALGPDGEGGSELYDLFLADVLRDITQKAGQKCTAIRRVMVPRERLADVAADLVDRLRAVRVGDPADESVQMGPVATAAQREAVRAGIALLAAAPGLTLLCGGTEAPPLHAGQAGRGYFVAPTLLLAVGDQPLSPGHPVHQHEVFGPVATLMPYDSVADLVQLLRLGGGSLVASLYSDDRALVPAVVRGAAAAHGRIFLGSARLAGQSPGPGTALPLMNHGGPGRAGDGQELGGVRGLQFYMQRCAVMGYRPTVEGLLPLASAARV